VAPQGNPHVVITHGYLSFQWTQRSAIRPETDAHVEPAP
jgi:hypothetical protein